MDKKYVYMIHHNYDGNDIRGNEVEYVFIGTVLEVKQLVDKLNLEDDKIRSYINSGEDDMARWRINKCGYFYSLATVLDSNSDTVTSWSRLNQILDR